MNGILLPGGEERPLSFYLAMEEHVAAAYGSGFFVWRVAPTVIIGRNQDIYSEVNLAYCREHGIDVVRRKSGGGCVFADKGNVMISYVTPRRRVENVFSEYLDRLSSFLRTLGFDAVTSSNNDVCVGGFKVSGNAFFVHPDADIVHGTLLHSLDFGMMERAITPSVEKLGKHGVQSVRQRVVNLASLGLDMGPEELEEALMAAFCDSRAMLSPQDMKAVEEIERTYTDPAFLFGKAQENTYI